MIVVGVPKEIKNHEYRVGLIPTSVKQFVREGHEILVQKDAGLGSGFTDEDYKAVGAKIIDSAKEIFSSASMIVKVKEPQIAELAMLRKEQILYTYLHLAPDPEQTKGLLASGCIAIAYETITDHNGRLPLLAPMSKVAGRLAVQAGAHFLEKPQGGRGILLGGVPGVPRGEVVIVGGGVAGTHSAEIAVGLGANVTILDNNHQRLDELHYTFGGRIKTIYSTQTAIDDLLPSADLFISSVLIPGAHTPRIITRETLKTMKKGSVIVDISIDQGGSCETSRATTHQNPTFIEEGVIHYCVANMPGAVSRTSAIALNNSTLSFGLALAKDGMKAVKSSKYLMDGLNIYKGKITNKPVADALKDKIDFEFAEPQSLL